MYDTSSMMWSLNTPVDMRGQFHRAKLQDAQHIVIVFERDFSFNTLCF
jgi:hypothetical protein